MIIKHGLERKEWLRRMTKIAVVLAANAVKEKSTQLAAENNTSP